MNHPNMFYKQIWFSMLDWLGTRFWWLCYLSTGRLLLLLELVCLYLISLPFIFIWDLMFCVGNNVHLLVRILCISVTMLNLISRFISILCTAYSNAYFISKMFVSCFFILHQIVHQIIMGHGYKNWEYFMLS